MNATGAKAGRREWIGLSVLMLPLLLVSMDVSVLFFAIPFISADLAPTSTEQLWIFDIYGFVLAGLLITMGSLGDRIGRRRLLMIGATGFGLASLAAAYATTPEMLIVARALLGIGGATLMPSTLALIRNMFHDDKQRSTAIAIWTAGMTFGISLGPILSGFLLEHFWWGSVFLINTPFMVLLLVLAPVLIPEYRNPQAGRFDLVSSALSLAAVLPVIYGIKEIAAHGVDALRVGSIVVGLSFAAFFLRRQYSHNPPPDGGPPPPRPDPMIDFKLFRHRAFGGSIAMNLVAIFGLAGFAIFTTQYLQSVLGMQPLEAALWSLLGSAGVFIAAPTASVLAQRGVRRANIVGTGFVLAVAGFVVMTRLPTDSGLLLVLLGATLMASGLVVAMSMLTEMTMSTVPPERAGSGSALLETASEFGGALGMAVLGSIGVAVYRDEVTAALPAGTPAEAADAVRETLGSATAVAAELPGPAGDAVLAVARTAFTSGLHVAAITAAAVMALAAVVSVIVLRQATPAASPNQPEPNGELPLPVSSSPAG